MKQTRGIDTSVGVTASNFFRQKLPVCSSTAECTRLSFKKIQVSGAYIQWHSDCRLSCESYNRQNYVVEELCAGFAETENVKFSPWNFKEVIYRVSQKECARLRESVPYVKLYRYNPKHLYPKLNGYGDNGQRSVKLWQLLLTYWLSNTYWNWQEYVVSVMLISVLNIKLTCECHKAIKLNYKNTRTHVIVVLRGTKHFTQAAADA